MKLLKLNIDSHFHLENISFDFTYPKGHTKAGMPLEKICIIGQSASGKTTILDLIKIGILKLDSLEVVGNTLSTLNSSENIDFKLNGSIEYIIDNEILEISKDKVRKGDYLIPYGHESGTIQKLIFNDVKLLYFSSDIVSKENISVFEQNPTVINTDEELKKMERFYKTNYYTLSLLSSITTRYWLSGL